MNKYLKFCLRLLVQPPELVSFVTALLRGTLYILWFRLTRRNVIIRFPFLCHARVEISGPGKVFIDRRCSVYMNTFDHLAIMTLSRHASVTIGRNCTLGGVTIRCRGRIAIGDNVLTAGNLIQDVAVCNASLQANARSDARAPSEAVSGDIMIGNDVWLSGQALVLDGSTIGDGSVIGLNCLLYQKRIDDHCLVVGNPALRPVSIAKLDGLVRAH